jgi:hypothetical protein
MVHLKKFVCCQGFCIFANVKQFRIRNNPMAEETLKGRSRPKPGTTKASQSRSQIAGSRVEVLVRAEMQGGTLSRLLQQGGSVPTTGFCSLTAFGRSFVVLMKQPSFEHIWQHLTEIPISAPAHRLSEQAQSS